MTDQAPASAPSAISFDEFSRVKLRVGKVVEASDHPNADKLLVLKVDLGDERRQIVAGIKGYYRADQLLGKNLVIVTNLVPRVMRGIESQGMLLAASTADRAKVVVLTPDAEVPPGSPVS